MKTKIILLDIDGCIMPPNRSEANLLKINKLKDYVHQTLKNQSLPKVTIYTGRSQEYVEFLSQVIGLVNSDIPFVIENGCALYFPISKTTKATFENTRTTQKAKSILQEKLPNNPFEPKKYIVTINPVENQTILELKELTIGILKDFNILDALEVTNSASSVDILPKGINKLYGVKYLIQHYLSKDIKTIAIGDSSTDKDVLLYSTYAYAPSNASEALKATLKSNHPNASILQESDIDAVLRMFKIEIP